MAYLGITIGLLFIFYSILKFKNKVNPLLIFSALWTVIIILSKIRLFGLKETDEFAYFIIAIGMFCFGLSYCIAYRVSFKRNIPCAKYNDKIKVMYEPRYFIIYFLCLITLIYYLKDIGQIVSSLTSGNILAQIRLLSQDPESVLYSGRSKVETAFRMLITQPFNMALQPIVAVELYKKTKHRWILFGIDVVMVFLLMLSQGSRSTVMYLGLNIFVVFMFSIGASKNTKKMLDTKHKKRNKKIKRLMFLLIIICIVVLLVSSISRSGDNYIKYLYFDFSMPPYMLGEWLKEVDGYGFGTASLNGLIYPIIYFVKNTLGLPGYPEYWYKNVYLMIDSTDKVWQIIDISGKSSANAYVSIFWFAYLDGGVFGVILIMSLFGIVASRLYKKATRTFSAKSLCLFALFMQGIIMSYVRLQFASISYALAFVYIALIFYKKKHISDKKSCLCVGGALRSSKSYIGDC